MRLSDRMIRLALIAACASPFALASPRHAHANDAARTYYFSTSGDDRNDGLSADRPKASLALVPQLLLPGTTILLRRGDAWDVRGLVWRLDNLRGTVEAPLLVADYGDPGLPRPVIAYEPRIVVTGTSHLTLARLDLRGGERWSGVRIGSGTRDVLVDDVAFTARPGKPPAAPLGAMSATTYYFSTSGADANSGTSEATPKKSLRVADSLLAPGVTVLFKRGDAWHEPELAWWFENLNQPGTPQDPIRIGAYGPSHEPRPILAHMVRNDYAEWTHEGDSVYSVPQYDPPNQAPTYDQVVRLYLVDPVTREGTPLLRVAGAGSSADSTYWVASDRVYVRCNAFRDAAWVESIQRYQTGRRGGRNVHYLTIEDIDFRGSGTGFALAFQAPTSHVTIRNCVVREFLSYGISFGILDTVSADLNTDVRIVSTRIDRGWRPALDYEAPYVVYDSNNEAHSFGANGNESGGDGILLAESVDGAVIDSCFITSMGHTGIGAQCNYAANFGVHNVVVERDTVVSGASGYCRGWAIGGTAAGVSDVSIRRCYFYDLNVGSQMAGQRVFVYSNVFERMSDTDLRPTPTAWHLIAQLDSPYVMLDCVVANNVFYDAESMVIADEGGVTTDQFNNNIFANNLFVNWKSTGQAANGHAVTVKDELLAELDLRNNGFWTDLSDTTILKTVGNALSLGATALNALANCDSNAYAEPQFVGGTGMDAAKWALSAGSPYRGGGTALATLLPPGMPAVDFFGNPYGFSPSRGAIQTPWTAAMGIEILGTPSSPFQLGGAFNLSSQLTPSNASIVTYAWTITRNGSTVATATTPGLGYTPTAIGTHVISLTAIDQAGALHAATPETVYVRQVPDLYATVSNGQSGTIVVEDGSVVGADVTVHISFADSVVATRNGTVFEMSVSGGVVSAEGVYVVTAHGLEVATLTFTIDRTPPSVSGVEDGRSYKTDVIIEYDEGSGRLNGLIFPSGGTVSNHGDYVLVVRDAANNTTTVNFTIDKILPEVYGVVDGFLYDQPVTISFNEGTATLDGNPFTSGGTVDSDGEYVLIVTDAATNATVVNFTIYLGPPTIELEDARGVILAENAVTDTGVTITLGRTVSATVTHDGSTTPLESGAQVSADGAYTITANGTSTVLRHFTIRRVPTLISPANGATAQPLRPEFSWTAPPSATSYRLQVSLSGGFSSVELDQSVSTTSYQPTNPQKLHKGQLYYWRVNATGPTGTTAWSPAWTFRTVQ